MLKDRSQLEDKLSYTLVETASNKSARPNEVSPHQAWFIEIAEKYNIPVGMASDIVTLRKDLSGYNEFILFAVTDVVKPSWIPEFFTEQEIKLYRDKKYSVEKFSFPIKLHLIKVTDDQYIGKTTAQFLMQLRDNQLVNYNAETQRALRIMLHGGTKVLRPYINEDAVTDITRMFADGTFISNMITLNINMDDENAEYYYNEREEILKISNVTAFDIVDGYHRFLGMSRNYTRDETWDYPMMIQITTFSVGKAKQFIYQEDHQTKMKEVDAAAYNQYDHGNTVANRLNTDPDCYLCGQVNLTGGYVNSGILAQTINRLYFPKKVQKSEEIRIGKEIQRKLNSFIEENLEYMNRTWETYEIITIMYGLYNNFTPEQIYKAIHSISKDDIDTLNRNKSLSMKALGIIREVY